MKEIETVARTLWLKTGTWTESKILVVSMRLPTLPDVLAVQFQQNIFFQVPKQSSSGLQPSNG